MTEALVTGTSLESGAVPGAQTSPVRHGVMLDAALVGVVIVLTAATVASVAVPGMFPGVVNTSLSLVIHTVAAIISILVAVLAWMRYRQGGEPGAAFETAAFLVLALVGGIPVLLIALGLDGQAGLTLASPAEAPLKALTVVRVFAAALLVAGGIATLRSRHLGHGLAIVLGSAGVALVLLALFQYGSGWMPALWVTGEPGPSAGLSGAGHYPPPTPFGATVQVAGAALFLFAAALSRRLYRRDGMVGDRFLAVGLVFAAFAQVQPSDYPGTYTGLVTSDDLLRVAFGIVLLAGLQAQASAYLAHLRLANEAMSRSRETDAEHAALEERTRLARELHDGLAQDLWVAKLKSRRLTAQPNLDLETRALVDDLSEAIDAGLADAQQAVAAIRLPGEAAGTFSELMGQCVDEFADRFGLQAEFAIEEPLPQLTARAQAEALRIAREALSNASRHADATVVRVRAGVDAGRFVVTVGDNGRGFDPGAVGRSAFGLASMRERAALIGGELRIDSRPHDGTRVSLIVPLAVAAVPVVVGAA